MNAGRLTEQRLLERYDCGQLISRQHHLGNVLHGVQSWQVRLGLLLLLLLPGGARGQPAAAGAAGLALQAARGRGRRRPGGQAAAALRPQRRLGRLEALDWLVGWGGCQAGACPIWHCWRPCRSSSPRHCRSSCHSCHLPRPAAAGRASWGRHMLLLPPGTRRRAALLLLHTRLHTRLLLDGNRRRRQQAWRRGGTVAAAAAGRRTLRRRPLLHGRLRRCQRRRLLLLLLLLLLLPGRRLLPRRLLLPCWWSRRPLSQLLLPLAGLQRWRQLVGGLGDPEVLAAAGRRQRARGRRSGLLLLHLLLLPGWLLLLLLLLPLLRKRLLVIVIAGLKQVRNGLRQGLRRRSGCRPPPGSKPLLQVAVVCQPLPRLARLVLKVAVVLQGRCFRGRRRRRRIAVLPLGCEWRSRWACFSMLGWGINALLCGASWVSLELHISREAASSVHRHGRVAPAEGSAGAAAGRLVGGSRPPLFLPPPAFLACSGKACGAEGRRGGLKARPSVCHVAFHTPVVAAEACSGSRASPFWPLRALSPRVRPQAALRASQGGGHAAQGPARRGRGSSVSRWASAAARSAW